MTKNKYAVAIFIIIGLVLGVGAYGWTVYNANSPCAAIFRSCKSIKITWDNIKSITITAPEEIHLLTSVFDDSFLRTGTEDKYGPLDRWSLLIEYDYPMDMSKGEMPFVVAVMQADDVMVRMYPANGVTSMPKYVEAVKQTIRKHDPAFKQ